jgi:hypothetical protein
MKFSQTISWVKQLNGEKTNVLKTISVLLLRSTETEDRDGLQNVGDPYQHPEDEDRDCL